MVYLSCVLFNLPEASKSPTGGFSVSLQVAKAKMSFHSSALPREVVVVDILMHCFRAAHENGDKSFSGENQF